MYFSTISQKGSWDSKITLNLKATQKVSGGTEIEQLQVLKSKFML